jgi:hypothetical protein
LFLRWVEIATLLGPLETANVSHWTSNWTEDGNRPSFQNVGFSTFRILDDGQSSKTQKFWVLEI